MGRGNPQVPCSLNRTRPQTERGFRPRARRRTIEQTPSRTSPRRIYLRHQDRLPTGHDCGPLRPHIPTASDLTSTLPPVSLLFCLGIGWCLHPLIHLLLQQTQKLVFTLVFLIFVFPVRVSRQKVLAARFFRSPWRIKDFGFLGLFDLIHRFCCFHR